jgi:hypothetical protein
MMAALAIAPPTLSPMETALAPGTFRLTVTEGALSLEAHEASVAAIFAEIAQYTGIKIVLHIPADQTITTHFTQVPLREAFKRLASNVVILDAQGPQAPSHRVAKVYVLPAGQSGSSQPVPPMSQDTNVPQAVTRPAPFKFTFDPSQPEKQSP